MSSTWNPDWPVLTTYDSDHLHRLALPLGGIGTGTVSLGGRGDLRDWEVMNRPAKGYVLRMQPESRACTPSFVLYAKGAGGAAVCRLLEGPLELAEYEGGSGSAAPNAGLPRFRRCRFAAAYPLGQVALNDPEVPVEVRLEAFNPLIPGDAERSGLPVAVLRYVVSNPTSRKQTVAICGSIPNSIGVDGASHATSWSGERFAVGQQENRNSWRVGDKVRGIFMSSEGVPTGHPAWGTMALATTASRGLSYRTSWSSLSWGDTLLDFWDDLLDDGKLEEREGGHAGPMGSLCARFAVPAGESRAVTFLITWHFPNRQTWSPQPAEEGCGCEGGACAPAENTIGNYYTTRFADAWDAAERVAGDLRVLEAETLRFVDAFVGCDLPGVVKEAALNNLSTLRSQTCFRIPSGHFFGWEGCHDHQGCCPGSCTHVWNYEQALPFLFGELAVSMRDVEFTYATDDEGMMSFRTNLPLARGSEMGKAAADGQMGCLMKLYREWQLSGDEAMLRRLWPRARKALEFCWVAGGWDADRDGVMEGCQHNTMDVEYYGPNPQMQGWYLGALKAAEQMADALGETDFAEQCRGLFAAGSAWMDDHLFNGDYYEHEIRPIASAEAIHPALRHHMGSDNPADPELQLGAGCLVDQLVGQYMAHVCGLGYLHGTRQIRKTLRSILKYNRRRGFHGHFNHMRSYVLGDETALLMASYPKGGRPRRPFPYFNEVMTGFEYTVAAHLIYEGQTKKGVGVIKDIRERYDGRKRSPFDEAECGHHYARAMASWASVLALTGFHWSAVDGVLEVAAADGTWFWSTGYAYGTIRIKSGKKYTKVRLNVLGGKLTLATIRLQGKGSTSFDVPREVAAVETINFKL